MSNLMEQNYARLRQYIQSSDTAPKQSSETPRKARTELAMAIGIRGFAAIIAVAALMVIGVACGNGAEPTSLSDSCNLPDNLNWVAGEGECLKIKTLNKEFSGQNPTLVIFLQGDVSKGGPASYFYSRAEMFVQSNVAPVVLIRPGYYDSEGNHSTGSDCGRWNCYTPHNVDAIADAIKSIKEFHKARNVILVGHSDGAAIAGVILGRHPGLVDGAILAACPCNIDEWRLSRGKSAWSSLSPHSFTDGIPSTTQVIAITGDQDENTPPFLAEEYIEGLKANGIKASFVSVEGGTHNSSARSSEFNNAIWGLIGEKEIG